MIFVGLVTFVLFKNHFLYYIIFIFFIVFLCVIYIMVLAFVHHCQLFVVRKEMIKNLKNRIKHLKTGFVFCFR